MAAPALAVWGAAAGLLLRLTCLLVRLNSSGVQPCTLHTAEQLCQAACSPATGCLGMACASLCAWYSQLSRPADHALDLVPQSFHCMCTQEGTLQCLRHFSHLVPRRQTAGAYVRTACFSSSQLHGSGPTALCTGARYAPRVHVNNSVGQAGASCAWQAHILQHLGAVATAAR